MEHTQTTSVNRVSAKEDFKTPRVRSVAYPSYTIQHCLELSETIHKLFGNSVYIPREKICEKTGISDSHIQMQLSSCVQYKLLDMRSKEGYKTTQSFVQIYKPKPNEDVRRLKIALFTNPELYSKFIAEHNNENFTEDGLATLLYRDYKVSENASVVAAKVFIENARNLGLISDDNTFDIGSDENITTIEAIEDKPKINLTQDEPEVQYLPPAREDPKRGNAFNHPPIPVFVDDNGSVAEVYLPNGFNKAHIERIIRVLQAQIA